MDNKPELDGLCLDTHVDVAIGYNKLNTRNDTPSMKEPVTRTLIRREGASVIEKD